jgi:hypothetical protein
MYWLLIIGIIMILSARIVELEDKARQLRILCCISIDELKKIIGRLEHGVENIERYDVNSIAKEKFSKLNDEIENDKCLQYDLQLLYHLYKQGIITKQIQHEYIDKLKMVVDDLEYEYIDKLKMVVNDLKYEILGKLEYKEKPSYKDEGSTLKKGGE